MRITTDLAFGYRGHPVFESLRLDLTQFPLVLLGPNGAGKTTLLKLLAGQLRPASGAAQVGQWSSDTRAGRASLRRTIGWMPQTIHPMSGLTVHDQVAYAGWLKGMSSAEAGRQSRLALEAVGLAEKMKRPPGTLSGGQLRRVGLAEAIVADPALILMDEPSAGLDPEQRGTLRSLIREMGEEIPIIVSTHQTDDLSDLYRMVLVIVDGRVRFTGSPQEFLALADADVPLAFQAEQAYKRVAGVSD